MAIIFVNCMDVCTTKSTIHIFRTPLMYLGTNHCGSIKGEFSCYVILKHGSLSACEVCSAWLHAWGLTHVTSAYQFYCCMAALTVCLCLIYINMQRESNLTLNQVPGRILSGEIMWITFQSIRKPYIVLWVCCCKLMAWHKICRYVYV